ncbi:MAG: DUF1015 family protein [Acidimicrobiales bacterium]
MFTLADANDEKAFLAEAEAAGMENLKGHRSVGGMRASIYNVLSTESVAALTDFMAHLRQPALSRGCDYPTCHPSRRARVDRPGPVASSRRTTPAMRREILADNPYSYLAVTRSQEDLPDHLSLTDDQLLAAGRLALGSLLDAGVFGPSTSPRLLAYRLTTDFHTQTGIVCGVAVDDFETGRVKVHEQIHPERATHLARHFEIVGAQSSPIALAHEPNQTVAEVLDLITTSSLPVVTVNGDDGLLQQVWPIESPRLIEQITGALEDQSLYLIDGHHRASAASQFRARTGDPAADWTLSALFSTTELANFPHHRTLPAEVADHAFIDRLGAITALRVLTGDHPFEQATADELVIYHNGTWYGVDAPVDTTAHASLAHLDQQRLERLFDLVDADQESTFRRAVRYRPGVLPPTALAAEIDMAGGCLFHLRQVSMDALLAVADAGLTMPPKSTYFEPKVRSGLFLRPCTSADL